MKALQKYRGIVFLIIVGIIFAAYISFSHYGGSYLWEHSYNVGRILFFISILGFLSIFFYDSKYLTFLILGYFGVQIYLIMTLAPVHNDSLRYIYDGVVSRIDFKEGFSGVSSFRYTPDEIHHGNVAVEHVQQSEKIKTVYQDTWWWELLDFKHLHTIYPGTAQSYFLLSSFFEGNEILLLRLVLLIASIVLIYFILKIAEVLDVKKENLNVLPFLILNPIWFFDGVLGIHLEMLLITFLCGAVYAFLKRKYFFSGAMLSLSIFTKLYPLLFVPIFLLQNQYTNKKERGIFLLGMIFGSLINLPFLYQEIHYEHLLESVRRFQELWIASPGMYYLIEQLVGNHTDIITVLIIFGTIIINYYYVYRQKFNLIHAIAIVFIVYIFFSKTIFSWYLLPILVLLPFITGRYKIIVLTPLLFYGLQYSFIDATNEVNNTFIYTDNGIKLWFQGIVWIPVINAIFLIGLWKIRELNNNKI